MNLEGLNGATIIHPGRKSKFQITLWSPIFNEPSGLRQVSGIVTVNSNPLLVDLLSFENLSNITGLFVGSNAASQDLQGFSGVEVNRGDICIHKNKGLRGLDDLVQTERN